MARILLHIAVASCTFTIGLSASSVWVMRDSRGVPSSGAAPIVTVTVEAPSNDQDSKDGRCQRVNEMVRAGVFSRIVPSDERKECKEWEEARAHGERSGVSP